MSNAIVDQCGEYVYVYDSIRKRENRKLRVRIRTATLVREGLPHGVFGLREGKRLRQ